MTPSRRFGLFFRGFAQRGFEHGPTQTEASISPGKEVAMRYYQTQGQRSLRNYLKSHVGGKASLR